MCSEKVALELMVIPRSQTDVLVCIIDLLFDLYSG